MSSQRIKASSYVESFKVEAFTLPAKTPYLCRVRATPETGGTDCQVLVRSANMQRAGPRLCLHFHYGGQEDSVGGSTATMKCSIIRWCHLLTEDDVSAESVCRRGVHNEAQTSRLGLVAGSTVPRD